MGLRLGIVAAMVAVLAAIGVPAIANSGTGLIITKVAGNGYECSFGSCGDGRAATAALLNAPNGVAFDQAGNLYIADTGDNQVRVVSPSGIISTLAGTASACSDPTSCGDGGPAKAAQLYLPFGVAVGPDGTVYIADSGDNEIRQVDTSGTITVLAGTGKDCKTAPACGDAGPATSAQLNFPTALAVDSHGNVYIADTGDNEVRVVSPAGIISRLAGSGSACTSAPNCGDGGTAASAQLHQPSGLALDASGNLYIADESDNEVRVVSPGGSISRFAGTGAPCATTPLCGDGRAATAAQLSNPSGVAVAGGTVYIADAGDAEVRAVSPAGTINRFAGDGHGCTPQPSSPPDCSDGQLAVNAHLDAPAAIAVGSVGQVYIADNGDNEIRQVAFGPLPPPPPVLPTVSELRVSPHKFVVAGRLVRRSCVKATHHNRSHRRCRRHPRLRVSYTLNLADPVRLIVDRSAPGRIFKGRCVPASAFLRHATHCSYIKSQVGSFDRTGRAGTNSFIWKGRVAGKRLRPGTYLLRAYPLATGAVGDQFAFTIKH